jgi:hypothetical protein
LNTLLCHENETLTSTTLQPERWWDEVSEEQPYVPLIFDYSPCKNSGFIAESLGPIARGALCVIMVIFVGQNSSFSEVTVCHGFDSQDG